MTVRCDPMSCQGGWLRPPTPVAVSWNPETRDAGRCFAKSSLSRETELVDGRLRRTVQVEESGIGVRVWDGTRAGFAASSGLERASARTAVSSARAGAAPGPDPMPPRRLLGTTAVQPGPKMPPRGWAQHVTSELGPALASLSGGVLRLGRAIAQEGRYVWSLCTADDWSVEHQRTVASILVEVLVGDRPGTWREWIHVADPESFDADATAARIGNRALLTRHRIATDRGLHDLLLHPEVERPTSRRDLAALSRSAR